MSIYLIIVAISLSIDAVFVCIARGTYTRNLKFHRVFELPILFGVFQGIMPILGYQIGYLVKGFFVGYEYFIGGGLLIGVGIKMVYEAITSSGDQTYESITLTLALIFAIATSMDAFSVGASFAFIKHPIYMLALLSGTITFFFSFLGICIGRRLGKIIGEKAEIASGIVIILLGIEIIFKNF